jgi:hypothetical protein
MDYYAIKIFAVEISKRKGENKKFSEEVFI